MPNLLRITKPIFVLGLLLFCISCKVKQNKNTNTIDGYGSVAINQDYYHTVWFDNEDSTKAKYKIDFDLIKITMTNIMNATSDTAYYKIYRDSLAYYPSVGGKILFDIQHFTNNHLSLRPRESNITKDIELQFYKKQ